MDSVNTESKQGGRLAVLSDTYAQEEENHSREHRWEKKHRGDLRGHQETQ